MPDTLTRFGTNLTGAKARLTSSELAIHQCFRPSKDWSELELLQWRKTVTAKSPNLPQRAGRAFAALQAAAEFKAAHPVVLRPLDFTKRRAEEERHITVKYLVRDDPDLKLLARAVIELAKYLEQQRLEAESSRDEEAA